MDKPKAHGPGHDLREKRKQLHGKRRRLHERLSDVCEEFVLEDLTPEHRRSALVGELQYLLDYYRDEANWQTRLPTRCHRRAIFCWITTATRPTGRASND